MYNIINQFTPEVTVLVSLFALAWLLIGIILGSRLNRSESDRGRDRDRGDKPRGGKQGRRGGGRGGEVVELYVGNLAYEVSEKELNKSFAEYGELISARVIKNRFSGKSKGFGFVEIAGREEANAAVRALNGKDFKGRRIVVNEARSHSRE
jgi:hypothetical protein